MENNKADLSEEAKDKLRYLFQKSADVVNAIEAGKSPMEVAYRFGSFNQEFLGILLELKAFKG